MDETVLKISLAAFLHDIGKFADKQPMGISEDFLATLTVSSLGNKHEIVAID